MPFEEIHPTVEQIAKSPDDIKHGIIVFAGGHVILHLKQDVLIDNLVEDEIRRRAADERGANNKDNFDTNARSRGHHDTDLIPGVYEGNHKSHEYERKRDRTLHVYDRNHHHRKRHSIQTTNQNCIWDSRPIDHASSVGIGNRRRRPESRHNDTFSSKRHQVSVQPAPGPTKRLVRRNEFRHPWFNQDMAALIGLREKAHRKWAANRQRRKGDANWEAFKRCRSAVSALRRVRRNEYLVAALQVDALASAQPWQTKGIAKSATQAIYLYTYPLAQHAHGPYLQKASLKHIYTTHLPKTQTCVVCVFVWFLRASWNEFQRSF